MGLLGLFTPTKDLPLDRIPFPNPWSIGNIMPQSGHLTIERLACNSTVISPAGSYVRLVVNDAVIPWPSNQTGPGYSAPLDVFTDTITQNLPNYTAQCHVNSTYPQYFDLWWNYNTSTALNYQQGPISCAQTTTEF
jgi:acid phosphatase